MASLGLSILHDGGENPEVDLVAVHGLGGNVVRTWTHANGAFWLRDFLPLDICSARIMTFGYSSDVFSSSKTSINEYAELLLCHLEIKRKDAKAFRRPILFLGHSLGGIVIKKAMVTKDANYESEAIRRSTIAIVFMGTPHRGSSFASKGEKLVNFTQALGMKASTSDLVLLQLESTKLDDLCSEFATLINDRRIKVLTYIESRPLRIGPMELLVVPKSSAKLGLGAPLERVIALEGDHRQIVQYPSREDSQYLLVWNQLMKIISDHLAEVRAEERVSQQLENEEILTSLDVEGIFAAVPKYPAKGTCSWIRQRHEFQQWVDLPAPALLWIHGKPGVGKSVLSTYIAQLMKLENKSIIIHVAISKCRVPSTSMHNILRNILRQLLLETTLHERANGVLSELRRTYNSMPSVPSSELLEAVNEILCEGKYLHILVDGVDECNFQDPVVEQFVQWLNQSSGKEPKSWKALITSRDTPRLRAILKGCSQMKILEQDSLQDIAIFTEQIVGSHPHLADQKQHITEQVVRHSNGIFLWADVAVKELDQLYTHNGISKILEISNSGLQSTYASIMRQLEASAGGLHALRARLLPLIACAQESLTVQEIQEFLAVTLGQSELDRGNSLIGGWQTIHQACGSFLQLGTGQSVELLHASAKDFILSQSTTGGAFKFAFSADTAHAEMASICLTYLSSRSLLELQDFDTSQLPRLARRCSFLRYATLRWWKHFIMVKSIGTREIRILNTFIKSENGQRWAILFFPYFCRKDGENYLSTLKLIQSIIARIRKCLQSSTNILPPDYLSIVDNLDCFVLESLDKSYEAEVFLRGPTAISTIERLLQAADGYATHHQFENSKRAAERAEKLARAHHGPTNALTLRSQHLRMRAEMQLQVLHTKVVSRDFADELIQLASKFSLCCGEFSTETLCCRQDIGIAYLMECNWLKARDILEPVYEDMKSVLGSTSRLTQRTTNNLALAAYHLNECRYAEDIIMSLPEVRSASVDYLSTDLTEFHHYTFDSLSLLGAIALLNGDFNRAELLHRRVIDGLCILDGLKAKRIYDNAFDLGLALQNQRKFKEAKEHYQFWLRASNKNFGSKSATSKKFHQRLRHLSTEEWKWRYQIGTAPFRAVDTFRWPITENIFASTVSETRFLILMLVSAIVLGFYLSRAK